MTVRLRIFALVWLVTAGLSGPSASAADLTARQVTATLFKAEAAQRIDLSGKDLSELDLSGLDFKSAHLAKVNFYGADLSDAKLAGANLAGAQLNRALLTRANFSNANLEGATILKPSIFASPDFNVGESPVFERANLRDARIAARLDGVNFRHADLSGARIGPFDMKVEGGLAPSSIMRGADFTGANLSGTDIRNVDFTFGRFSGAKLNGAQLEALDLTNTDFTGADLTGATLKRCNVAGANFSGATGLDRILGLDTVLNRERAEW